MAEIIYVRVSTDKQEHESQIHGLTHRYPGAELVTEVCSGGKARPVLKSLVQRLSRGDRLIVAALDRLGRSTRDVISMIEDLNERGVTVISEREKIDYSTPAGRMMVQVLASVAELERSMASERTKAGMAVARRRGRQIGRVPEIPDSVIDEGIRLVREYGFSIRKAAEVVEISSTYLSKRLQSENNFSTLEKT